MLSVARIYYFVISFIDTDPMEDGRLSKTGPYSRPSRPPFLRGYSGMMMGVIQWLMPDTTGGIVASGTPGLICVRCLLV